MVSGELVRRAVTIRSETSAWRKPASLAIASDPLHLLLSKPSLFE